MNICGIDTKSSDAIITILNTDTGAYLGSTKISLSDEYSSAQLKSFKTLINAFLRDNGIEIISIGKGATHGIRAGNSASFKIECLIQLNDVAPVKFMPLATVRSIVNKNIPKYPMKIAKYQVRSFDIAYALIMKI